MDDYLDWRKRKKEEYERLERLNPQQFSLFHDEERAAQRDLNASHIERIKKEMLERSEARAKGEPTTTGYEPTEEELAQKRETDLQNHMKAIEGTHTFSDDYTQDPENPGGTRGEWSSEL